MTNISATKDKASAGDPIPPKCSVIEVHVGELKQLFDAIDPSPFRDRDLDPKAEEFIVGRAKDLPRDATLALVVEESSLVGQTRLAIDLRDAIHEFFRHRAERYRQPSAGIVSRGPDQSGDRSDCVGGRYRPRGFSCHSDEGQPYRGNSTREPHHRRLGLYVASP